MEPPRTQNLTSDEEEEHDDGNLRHLAPLPVRLQKPPRERAAHFLFSLRRGLQLHGDLMSIRTRIRILGQVSVRPGALTELTSQRKSQPVTVISKRTVWCQRMGTYDVQKLHVGLTDASCHHTPGEEKDSL